MGCSGGVGPPKWGIWYGAWVSAGRSSKDGCAGMTGCGGLMEYCTGLVELDPLSELPCVIMLLLFSILPIKPVAKTS